jgi:hypothetical protein
VSKATRRYQRRFNEKTPMDLRAELKSKIARGKITPEVKPDPVGVAALPKDDQPITKAKSDAITIGNMADPGAYYREQIMRSMGIGLFTQVSRSWVPDSFNPAQMLRELESRPQGRFGEIEDFTHRGNKCCRCERCCYERRSLIRELRDIACENR